MGEVDYGQIMAHSAESSDIGNTVTFKSGSMTFSGTMGSDGYCNKILPGFRKWNVVMGDYTSEDIYLGYGENRFVEIGYSVESWSGIKRIIDAGKAADYISNGDRFTVELSTGEVLVYEANVNTYGLGEVDFIPTYCMAVTKQHHTSNTNSGGWNNSDIRNFLNNTFLMTLPADLQAVISEKPVKATIGGQNNSLQTAEDKIWLPTEKEVFGQITYSGSAEGPVNNQYPIFTDAASRVRTQGSNGSAVYTWLVSPHVSNSYFFCYVGATGTPYYNAASDSYGVLPCFRIAPAA